jgi:hypothetical protein
MSMTNTWHPAETPDFSFPPPGLPPMQAADKSAWVTILEESGFTLEAPTPQEKTAYFATAECGDGHSVNQNSSDCFMAQYITGGVTYRYPFCICADTDHHEFMIPIAPFWLGAYSG